MEAQGSAAGFLALLIFLLQLADGQMTIGEGTSDPPVHNISGDHIQPIPAVGQTQLPSSTTTDDSYVAGTQRIKENIPDIPMTTKTTPTTLRQDKGGPPDTDKGGGTRVDIPGVPPSPSSTDASDMSPIDTGSAISADNTNPDTTDNIDNSDAEFNDTPDTGANVSLLNDSLPTGDSLKNNSQDSFLCPNSSCVLCSDNNSTNCSRLNNTIDSEIDSEYSDSSVNNMSYLAPYSPYYRDNERQQYEQYYKKGEDNFENSIEGDDDGQFDMDYYYDDDYTEKSKENISNGAYDIGDEDYYQQPSEDQWIKDRGQPSSIEGSELFYGPHGFEAQIGPLEELKLSRHEPVEIHPSFLDANSHDASLSILVFYTWIGVVIVMVIGAFIALKHRHRVTAIATYVWESRSAYRKETVFATEEGRNLLTHQQV